MNTTSLDRAPPGPSPRAHIEALLARYPNISSGEAGEIVHFLKNGAPLEVGMLTANDRVQFNLQRFRADRAADLSVSWREYAVAVLLVVVVIAAGALLWDAGAA